MTPEREAEIRARDRVALRADLLRDVIDLLTALDAERAAHEETRRRLADTERAAPALIAVARAAEALAVATVERDAAYPHASDDAVATARGLAASDAYETALTATCAALAELAKVTRE